MNLDVFNPLLVNYKDKERFQTSIVTTEDVALSSTNEAPLFPTVPPNTQDVSFMSTLNAQLGYAYTPATDALTNFFQFSESDRDNNYDPFADMENFEQYQDHLKDAVNEDHMFQLKRQLMANEKRREILANSSFGSQLVAGIFDPLNLIALPFGGFALGAIRAAGRTGAGVASVQALQEVGRYPFDPLATANEVGANIGMAFLGGMVIGGAVGKINTMKFNKAIKQLEESDKLSKDIADDTVVNPIVVKNKDSDGNVVNPKEEYIYHGTNLESRSFADDTETKKTVGSFIDEKGNLVLKASEDHLVGNEITGVSFSHTYNGAVPYTAKKNANLGTRDPSTELNNNSVIFQIKKDAVKKYDSIDEAMGEVVVKQDVTIKKGDYVLLKGKQKPTDHDIGRPFQNSSKAFVDGLKDQIPRSLDEVNKRIAKLEEDPDLFLADPDNGLRQLYERRNEILDIKKGEKTKVDTLVNRNKGLSKSIDVLSKYINNIKKARDTYRFELDKIRTQLEAQAKGETGFAIGLSKKQEDFLNNIKSKEATKFFNPSQRKTLLQHLDSIKKAQAEINKNKSNLLTKKEGNEEFISPEKITELNTELKNIQRVLGKESLLTVLKTNRRRMTDEYNRANEESKFRDIDEATMLDDNGVPIDRYNLIPNWFTKNPIYKVLVTPMKTALMSKSLTNLGKSYFHKAFGDNGMAQVAGQYGQTNGHSVATKASVWNRLVVSTHDKYRALYSEHTGKNQVYLDYDIQKKGYKQWLRASQEKIIRDEPLTDIEKKIKSIGDEFWTTWEKNLKEQGMIGDIATLNKNFNKENLRLYNQMNALTDILLKTNRKSGKLFIDEPTSILVKDLKKQTDKIIRGEETDVIFTDAILKTIDQFGNLNVKGLTKQTLYYKQNVLLPAIKKQVNELKMIKQTLEDAQTNRVLPANEEFFFPRYWDIAGIKANINGFKTVLTEWYTNNPTILRKKTDGTFERIDAITPQEISKAINPAAIAKRVDDTVNNIIRKNEDIADDSMAFYGHGKSMHLRHRTLDIPNKLVTEFIVTDPVEVMKVYTRRVAGRYEFNKMFDGRSVDQVADDLDFESYKGGMSPADINMHRKDFLHMYDRVVGQVIKNPDRWDQDVVNILRNLAQWNYLGSSGMSTIPDLAKILMEHEIGSVMKGLTGILQDSRVRLTAKEGRLAGEILEIFMGDVHLRNVEDLTSKQFDSGIQITASKVTNLFYLLNGLAPMTNLMKKLDAVIRQHEMVEFSIKDAKGTATARDIETLRRYGIDKDDSNAISKLYDDGVIQNSKEKGDGVFLANSDKWIDGGVDPKTLDNFRGAMNTGIMNTVLMGTPADKPIIADGVVYVPAWVGKKFGMKEDPKFRGYTRLETGLAGLPFQFWSYSFAAANKITAAMMTGQAKNRTAAITTALGLGWLSLQIKSEFNTPAGERMWDQLSFSDQLARSFDASGIAAIYSDLFYTAMNTSMALGGPDISGGMISPKFPQEENIADAATSIGGAGPSIATDLSRGMIQFLDGEYGSGSKLILKNLPYMRLWFIKDMVNELGNTLVDIDDDGFERSMRARF